MQKRIVVFGIISLLWAADTLWQLKQILTGPDCLQYCEVFLEKKSDPDVGGRRLFGKTIYGTDIEFLWQENRWALSEARDSGRRAIQSLRISHDGKFGSRAGDLFSVKLTGPFGIERMERLQAGENGTLLTPRTGSRLIGLHGNNITWIGDASVIVLSLYRSSINLVICSGVCASAWAVWRLSRRRNYTADIGLQRDEHAGGNRLSLVDLVTACCLVLSFTWLGWVGWPGLHWDSWAYSPPILSVAGGEGWLGVFPRDDVLNGRGYDGHGFLHVILFGVIFQCDTWEKLFLGMGLLNGFSAAGWYVISALLPSCLGSRSRAQSLLIGVMAGVVGVNVQGRPEMTVPPITILLALAQVGVKSRAKTLLLGGLSAGLAFISSPSSGIIAGLALILLWMSQGSRGVALLVWTGLSSLISLGVAGLAAFVFAPFSIMTWIRNVSSHTDVANDFSTHLFRFSLSGSDFLGISTISPFWNVFVLLNAFFVVALLARLRRWLELGLVACVLVYLWPKLTDYSYLPWFPLLTCSVPLCLRGMNLEITSMRNLRLLRIAASSFLSLYCLVFVQFQREAYEFFMYCREASVVRAELWDFLRSRGSGVSRRLGDVGVLWSAERSLANLSERDGLLTILEPHYSDKAWSKNDLHLFEVRGGPCDFVVKSLSYSGDASSMVFDDVRLAEAYRTKGRGRVCWFALRRRVVGYEVSVFKAFSQGL